MSEFTLRPALDSETVLELTPSTGTTHYVLVDEVIADDTDYVYTSSPSATDFYLINPDDIPSIPEGSIISGVTFYARFKGETYTQAKFKIKFQYAATPLYDVGSYAELTSSWAAYNSGLITLCPKTGVAWTTDDIFFMYLGITLVNGEFSATSSCSQLYCVVSYTVPATIDSFTATPENMEFGKSSLLAWETSNADTVTINQGIGNVGVDGTKTVIPTESTSYTISATNSLGTVYDYVVVTVIPSSEKIGTSLIAGSFPDRGILPQMGIDKSYLEHSSDVTEQYVRSLGFSFTGGDFKRPYLAKDYQSMMYLFNDTPSDISNGVRETQLSKITGSLPDRNDAYFDFSQTLASEDNFNAYAAENYRLMGKITPTASMSFSGAVESIFSDVDTNIPSKQNANLAVVSPRFSGDKYIWSGRVKDGTGDWGSFSSSSGLKTIYYTPTLTANQRNVIITLSSGGKALAELEFMVWFKG